jgi:hypothetical protein
LIYMKHYQKVSGTFGKFKDMKGPLQLNKGALVRENT